MKARRERNIIKGYMLNKIALFVVCIIILSSALLAGELLLLPSQFTLLLFNGHSFLFTRAIAYKDK